MARRERFEEAETVRPKPCKQHVCQECGNKGGMNFDCIKCCVRWLRGMNKEAMRINAPVIESVKGSEFMGQVRQAWRAR